MTDPTYLNPRFFKSSLLLFCVLFQSAISFATSMYKFRFTHFVLLNTLHIRTCHFCATFSVDACTDDSACIASSLTTRKQTLKANVHKGFTVAKNANWRTGACFRCYHCGFIGQETMGLFAESFKGFLQTSGNHFW